MHVCIHEGNTSALILADTLPPQHYTPWSKHYHIKTIWFRELIKKLKIKLVKIETVEQLGDPFTKLFPRFSLSTYGRISWIGSIKFLLGRECWWMPVLPVKSNFFWHRISSGRATLVGCLW
jgi:hypothetical protein